MTTCSTGSGHLQQPAGTNQASIGPGRFAASATVAAAWLCASLYLSVSWARELGDLVGSVAAWFLIGGIALAPGFMNAFQVASLLFRPRGRYLPQPEYPPLTILIAAYNEAANIGATLQSVDRQRYDGGLDVVVIDDGSIDDTAQKVRDAGYSWLRLLVQPCNRGKAAALNRGLAEARHELVVTLDADSSLHPDALRILVREYLNGQPQTAAVAGAVFVHNDRSSWVARLQQWDYFHGIAAAKRAQAAYGGTLVAQGAFSLYRREILLEIGGWPSCVGEDIVVTWAILGRGLIVGYAEEALCFTRVPETLGGLVRQRTRWARGMIEALRAHPGVLVRRRLTSFIASCNLAFPWIDFTFTFGFIPGLVLALFGCYWLVGPVTLALLPSAAFMGIVMYRMSARVFKTRGMAVSRDYAALLCYTLGYGLIMHPASLRGYMAELFGQRKSWGTK